MPAFYRIIGVAVFLFAVALTVMIAPKRPEPPAPTVKTYSAYALQLFPEVKVLWVGEPQTVNRALKGDRLVRADGEPMEEYSFHTAGRR